MQPKREVRAFLSSEWQIYRDLRLQALQDSPDAFGSTYAVSKAYRDDQWRDRLASHDQESQLPLVGLLDSQHLAMGWVSLIDSEAHLFQMWTHPKARGFGLGGAIVDAAIEWSRTKSKLLVLDVTVGNNTAEALYASRGFAPTGELSPLREGSDKQVKKMSRELRD